MKRITDGRHFKSSRVYSQITKKYKDLFKNSANNDTIITDTFFSLLMAEMKQPGSA